MRSPVSALQTVERPFRAVADDGARVLPRVQEHAAGRWIADVSEHDAGVALQADGVRAADRRALEVFRERFVARAEQPREIEPRVAGSRREVRIVLRRRAIVRTDLLAIVTAEHPAAERRAKVCGDGSAIFDRVVRDAAPRVDLAV